MQETTKYKLKKPGESDYADVAVLNENMDKVEEALGKKPDKTELPAEVKKAVQAGTLTAADLGAVSAEDKGKPNGVAGLGADGKVPQAQLPEMDYAPASHATDKNNPHGVTAAQVGATQQYGLLEGVNLLEWALEQTVGGTALTSNDVTGVPESTWWWVTLARMGNDACLTIQSGELMFQRQTYMEQWSDEKPWVKIAPKYTYGTADLTAGTSPLETGKLYFVYE